MQESNASMAQRAMQVHTEGGDRELLRFLVKHRMQDPLRDNLLKQAWEEGRFSLSDDSTVVLNELWGEVGFMWDGQMKARPTGIELRTIPDHPGSQLPLLGAWPSSNNIIHAVMQRLERLHQEVWKQVSDGPSQSRKEPMMTEYDALMAIPELNREVLDFIRNGYDMPNTLLRALEDEVQECAEIIMWKLPEESLEKLRNAIEARLREQTEG